MEYFADGQNRDKIKYKKAIWYLARGTLDKIKDGLEKN